MELSCSEVPLYGQVTVFAKFGKNVYLPKDAEFYFIYNGSHQRHVMFAHRVGNNILQSTVPGHEFREMVLVSVCLYSDGYSPVTMGCCSVTYVDNVACVLSRLLMSQVGCLTSRSHQTLLGQFGLTVKDLCDLEEDLVMAVAHVELPPMWSMLGNSSAEESVPKESLLHLTIRWGLVKFFQFLLGLPGGSEALALPNEEGVTPLDLALQLGHSHLVEVITKFQSSCLPESHSPDFGRARISDSASLRFVRSSGILTLTFNHTAEHLLENDIKLFRKYFWDRPFLYKVLDRNQVRQEEQLPMPTSATETENSVPSGSPPEREDVKSFKNIVVQPSENEDLPILDLERHHSFDVLKKSSHPPNFLATTKLSAMLNGGDEVYANSMVVDQVGDLDISYIDMGGVASTAGPESMDPDPSSARGSPASPKEVYMLEDNNPVAAIGRERQACCLTPGSRCVVGSHPPFTASGAEQDQSHLKKRSSSLDALDADSEGEGNSERCHICSPSVSHGSSATLANSQDELDSFETNAELDFNISRTESLSLSSNLQVKESLLSGVRSRSYSCSSPKVSFGKSRLVRDFAVCDASEEQRAHSLPEPSREKRIQEVEWDRYILPAKSESEKYKVSRTFSFLMNRMTSPRNKSKAKNKDAKEKGNRHQFVPGPGTGVLLCLVCDKVLPGKDSLQCSNCSASVHKSCKDGAPACTKKLQERFHSKNRPQAVFGNSSFKEPPPPGFSSLHPSPSLPVGLPPGKKEAPAQTYTLSRSVPIASLESFRRPVMSLESESDGGPWRSRSQSDELALLQSVGSSPSMDSFIMEDDVDSSLWSDLSSDAQEFEAESWSRIVDPSFCRRQEKNVIKRQDVIFELMQTELHHIQTLFIMSEIFRKGMKEELQLDHSTVDRIFPCLDELLEIHRHFFYCLKERRQASCEGSDQNFIITRIGDILVQQFSEENANKMKKIYGEFCSHHKEAVSLFKELQQSKKFQNFIKLRNSNLLARRRGIPECILLVTQRITKYPVLVERILRYSTEGTEEQKDLHKALRLIKDMVATVDLKVNEYEKKQKWLEILNKIENKTCTKLKNGHVFRKQTLLGRERTLLHDGLVYWKTATGRFKDILALLLTDVLLFLQEKDQKYIFAAVDQKPSVISLQKLIAREVANEERGMFLISASSAGPEMYEIHTNSKEERNNWMRRIQQAVERCPEEEGGKANESDEDKRRAEAVAARIQQCQETLRIQDQQICDCLEEKLQIYAELGKMSGFGDVQLEPHLLIKPDPREAPPAGSLVTAALKETETLHDAMRATQMMDAIQESGDGCGNSGLAPTPCAREVLGSTAPSLVPDIHQGRGSRDMDPNIRCLVNDVAGSDAGDKVEDLGIPVSTQAEIIQAIHNLTRLLFSLQAVLTIQESHMEIHRLVLQDHESLCQGRALRATLLPEAEGGDGLGKAGDPPADPPASLHKLQRQFQQEQERWRRRCEQQRREQEAQESRLQERERQCQAKLELLHRTRGELDHQLREHRQNVEMLREGQRKVEREREMMKIQQSPWRHNRQSSLPAAFSPRPGEEISLNRLDDSSHENSLFINEAMVLVSPNSLCTSNPPGVYREGSHLANASGETRTSEADQATLQKDTADPVDDPRQLWSSAGPSERTPAPLRGSSKDAGYNDPVAEPGWGLDLGSEQPQPTPEDQRNPGGDPDGGDGMEENIVYL
ncbi:rho guanine nucleotide exchange factor 28 isoform X1 [Ornithorhynchus anatinus]|uniref:Rho guanine nucleotide exchange factor 28 n=2 Tax=Ornithorhynchus anatinus TaxID=9258 RepID=F7FXP7_ORNAN|nr:rho guanine nucleotide exchange factor 28 isoform X1 [Ornithorhynchus anatinus]